MQVLLIVGTKCTLAATHSALVNHAEYAPRALLRLEKDIPDSGYSDMVIKP